LFISEMVFIIIIFCSIVESIYILNIDTNARWIQNGVTVAGGNGEGNGLNQLSRPVGMYIDDDQTIYIADKLNHRILEWKSDAKSGRVVAGGNGQGNRNDQFSDPVDVVLHEETNSFIICDKGNRRVVQWSRQNGASGQIIISDIDCSRLTMDRDSYLYVSDIKKHEVKRWRIGDNTGTVVAGGNGQGNRLNQLDNPTYVFVDEDQSVYVSDWENDRVMKWKKGSREGTVVAGGQGKGDGLSQLSGPQGVIVDQLGTVYVADCQNNRVMRWYNGATEGTIVVGGNGQVKRPNQLHKPQGISFDRYGNLYVVDQGNHRVQKFNIDSN
jgi:sugar lactone lactonase YvrE